MHIYFSNNSTTENDDVNTLNNTQGSSSNNNNKDILGDQFLDYDIDDRLINSVLLNDRYSLIAPDSTIDGNKSHISVENLFNDIPDMTEANFTIPDDVVNNNENGNSMPGSLSTHTLGTPHDMTAANAITASARNSEHLYDHTLTSFDPQYLSSDTEVYNLDSVLLSNRCSLTALGSKTSDDNKICNLVENPFRYISDMDELGFTILDDTANDVENSSVEDLFSDKFDYNSLSTSKQHTPYYKPSADEISVTGNDSEAGSSSEHYLTLLGTESENTGIEYEQSIKQISNSKELYKIIPPIEPNTYTYISEQFAIPKKLKITSRSYNFIDIRSTKLTINIYEDVIKRIDLDEHNLIINTISKEFCEKIKEAGFDKSHIDFSQTYIKMKNYISNEVSTHIDNIMLTADIPITPGMSICNIKQKYISNSVFFDKLHESCKEIAVKLNKIPHENFLSTLQTYISFGSKKRYLNVNLKRASIDKRNVLSKLIKLLIMNVMHNLPRKIQSEIESINKTDFLKSTFVLIHGVYVTKSFIKNVINIYNKGKAVMDSRSITTYEVFTKIRKELTEELRSSVVLFEDVACLPNESTIESMTKYLLSDIANIHFKENTELNETLDEVSPAYLGVKKRYIDIEDTRNFKKNSINLPSTNPQFTICEKYLSTYKQDTLEINPNNKIPEKLKLMSKSFKPVNIFSTNFTSGIYENAIKAIDIDEKKLLKNIILKEFSHPIEIKGFNKARIDISLTYSKMISYILTTVSPYINYIMRTVDISITPGMSISDIKNKYISNQIFFDKLQEYCKEIAKATDKILHKEFLKMIQSRVNFGLDKTLLLSMSRISIIRRSKLSALSKFLVVSTILDLPIKIKYAIEKFNLADVASCVFAPIHGVPLTKSFIKNITHTYKSVVINEHLEVNDSLIKEKLEKELQTSVTIFGEMVFSLNESMVEPMANYLLLDMNKFYFNNKSKLVVKDKYTPLTKEASKFYNAKQQYIDLKDNQSVTEEHNREGYTISDSYVSEQSPSINDQNTIEEELEKYLSDIKKNDALQDLAKNITIQKLEITTRVYSYNDIYSTKASESIYEKMIKKINFDENGLLSNTILEAFNDRIKSKDFYKSSADFSDTHSKILKYVLSVVSPFINDIMVDSDIVITPGINTFDIKNMYTSNQIFFNKLRNHCIKVSENINKIPHEGFLDVIQNSVKLNSNETLCINKKSISKDIRYKLSTLSKFLISDAIRNLPDSIISEIEKLDPTHILESTFIKLHDIYFTKSFIRNLLKVYTADTVNKLMEEKKYLMQSILEEAVKRSVILHEGEVFSPNSFTVKLITNHLLSDMITSASRRYHTYEKQKANLKRSLSGEQAPSPFVAKRTFTDA